MLTVRKRQGQTQYYDEGLDPAHLPLRMLRIPEGNFQMGSPEGELERSDSEGPQHPVTVAEFFMAKYPVTQAQWRAVAALPLVNRELKAYPSHFKGDKRPVETVSWYEAVEFCDRLAQHTHRPYRLPTEAEWEYACRAGTTTPFHFGPTLSTDYANYDGANKTSGTYGPGSRGDYRKETTPVDLFDAANAFGLVDMHGNVWEWCEDHWHSDYEGAPSDGSAWLDDNAEKNARRTLRGGSWIVLPRNCRSAYRIDYTPRVANYVIGFRVVCSAPRALL